MAAKDALALAIGAALWAKRKKEGMSGDDHPGVSIAVRAYWDGVQNLAAKMVDVFDDAATSPDAIEFVEQYADEMADYLRDALEVEDDG